MAPAPPYSPGAAVATATGSDIRDAPELTDLQRYFNDTLSPVLEDLSMAVLAEQPEAPASLMLRWLSDHCAGKGGAKLDNLRAEADKLRAEVAALEGKLKASGVSKGGPSPGMSTQKEGGASDGGPSPGRSMQGPGSASMIAQVGETSSSAVDGKSDEPAAEVPHVSTLPAPVPESAPSPSHAAAAAVAEVAPPAAGSDTSPAAKLSDGASREPEADVPAAPTSVGEPAAAAASDAEPVTDAAPASAGEPATAAAPDAEAVVADSAESVPIPAEAEHPVSGKDGDGGEAEDGAGKDAGGDVDGDKAEAEEEFEDEFEEDDFEEEDDEED